MNCLLENIVERTQDFTDSAYTSHDHRQSIIILSDRARLEMAQLCRLPGVSLHMDTEADTHMGLGERAGDGTVMAVRSVFIGLSLAPASRYPAQQTMDQNIGNMKYVSQCPPGCKIYKIHIVTQLQEPAADSGGPEGRAQSDRHRAHQVPG